MTKVSDLRQILERDGEYCLCPIWSDDDTLVQDGRRKRHESEPWTSYYSPRAGGVFHLRNDALPSPIMTFPATELLRGPTHRIRAKLKDPVLKLSPEERIGVSRHILEHNLRDEVPVLDKAVIRNKPHLRTDRRIEQLLRCVDSLSDRATTGLHLPRGTSHERYFQTELCQAGTECLYPRDLRWLLEESVNLGLLREDPAYEDHYILTAKAMERLEEIASRRAGSERAFVAMWFDESTTAAYDEGIAPAIKEAGYTPIRIDRTEHNKKIDDEIIAEIRRSRFLVADFTCDTVTVAGGEQRAIPRGGVYYEAGFARGLGIEVFSTCRTDHIKHVHFDTRQFNHILWRKPQDLRKALRDRIGAVIGDGPLANR